MTEGHQVTLPAEQDAVAVTVTAVSNDTFDGDRSITVAGSLGGTNFGTMQTITIADEDTASDNASLSALALSGVTLAPTFAPDVTSYAASVANATTRVTVTAATADAGSERRIPGWQRRPAHRCGRGRRPAGGPGGGRQRHPGEGDGGGRPHDPDLHGDGDAGGAGELRRPHGQRLVHDADGGGVPWERGHGLRLQQDRRHLTRRARRPDHRLRHRGVHGRRAPALGQRFRQRRRAHPVQAPRWPGAARLGLQLRRGRVHGERRRGSLHVRLSLGPAAGLHLERWPGGHRERGARQLPRDRRSGHHRDRGGRRDAGGGHLRHRRTPPGSTTPRTATSGSGWTRTARRTR